MIRINPANEPARPIDRAPDDRAVRSSCLSLNPTLKLLSISLLATLWMPGCYVPKPTVLTTDSQINLPTGPIRTGFGDRLPDENAGSVGSTGGIGPVSRTPTPSPSPPPTPRPSPTMDPATIKNAPGAYAWIYYPSGDYVGIESSFKVTNAPAPSVETGIIFWANQIQFEKDAAYVGLQIVGGTKKAIFSLWNAIGSDKGTPFLGEGEGYQYLIEYDWQIGRSYRLGIRMTGEDQTGRYWSGYVIDDTTGIRVDLATHKAPLSMGFIRHNVVWTEYATAGRCIAPYARVEFAGFGVTKLDGSRGESVAAVVNYPDHACQFSNVSRLSGKALSLATGGEIERLTPNYSRLW